MGAVFAAAARAPITAVIIVFELTGDYQVILPLMFAIAVAAGISTLLSQDTIYTLKLRRRGIDIRRGRGANLMQLIQVADAMQPASTSIDADTPLNELIAIFTETAADSLPVVDNDDIYRGTLTLRQIEQAMRENALDATAGDLAESLPTLTADASLEQALTTLLRTHTGVPVLDHDRGQVIGWLNHTNVLDAYNRRLEQALEHPQANDGEPAKEMRPSERPLSGLRTLRLVDLELPRCRPCRATTRRTPLAQLSASPRRGTLASGRSNHEQTSASSAATASPSSFPAPTRTRSPTSSQRLPRWNMTATSHANEGQPGTSSTR